MTPSLLFPDLPLCTSTNTSWLASSPCPDFYPKTPIYSSTSRPTSYTCAWTPIPYFIFAPRNISTLEDLAFADLIRVHKKKRTYEVNTFYCKELHTWFFPLYNTGFHLVFSQTTGALLKARSPTEEYLLDKATQNVGIRRQDQE
jgi:hypothetical protein